MRERMSFLWNFYKKYNILIYYMSYLACVDNPYFGAVATNVVTLNTDQTITGLKTFTQPIVSQEDAVDANQVIRFSQIENLIEKDAGATQTIIGEVTFNIDPLCAVAPTQPDNLVNLTYVSDNFVPLEADATLTGTITFSKIPVVSDATTVVPVAPEDLTTKAYVDAQPTRFGVLTNGALGASGNIASGDTSPALINITPDPGTYIFTTTVALTAITASDNFSLLNINVLLDGYIIASGGYQISSGISQATFPVNSFFSTDGTKVLQVEVTASTVKGGSWYVTTAGQASTYQLIQISALVS